MTYRKGDAVVLCLKDYATDAHIVSINEETNQAVVTVDRTGKSMRVSLNQIRPQPTGGPYTLDELRAA